MNAILSPAAISGIRTPVITQHLPPGAISYGAGQIGAGHRRKTKKRTNRHKTTKKVRKHRRSMKRNSLRRRKY